MNTWGGFVEYHVPTPIDVDRNIEANPVVDCASIAELLLKYGPKRPIRENAAVPSPSALPPEPSPVAAANVPELPLNPPAGTSEQETPLETPVSTVPVLSLDGNVDAIIPTSVTVDPQLPSPVAQPVFVIPVTELNKLLEQHGATVVGGNLLLPVLPNQCPAAIEAPTQGGSIPTEACSPIQEALSPMVQSMTSTLPGPQLTEMPDTPSEAFIESPLAAPIVSVDDESNSSTSTITAYVVSPTSSLSRKRSRQNSEDPFDSVDGASRTGSDAGWVKHFETEEAHERCNQISILPVMPTVTLIPFPRDENILSQPFPSRLDGIELKVTKQPETHHRARYRTEGSRGCVKDRSRMNCPEVQLTGYGGQDGVLLVFLASESGPVHPHNTYRAIRAGGRKATGCNYVKFGSIDVLQMEIKPSKQWTVKVDNMGIMKLRNTDLDGHCPRRSAKGAATKRSRKVRLAFRAIVPLSSGETLTLQTVSTPISCSAAPGQPEIIHLSHDEYAAAGGLDLIILGKNFLKDDSKVWISEKCEDDEVIWETTMPLKSEFYHNTHIVATVPPYHQTNIPTPVIVWVTVKNRNGKESDPVRFRYVPNSCMKEFLTNESCFTSATCTPTNKESDVPLSMAPDYTNAFYPLDFFGTDSQDNASSEQVFNDLLLDIFGSAVLPEGCQQVLSGVADVSLVDRSN